MSEPSQILDRVAAVADELKLVGLRPQITACRHQLHAGAGIDVAVFGRFKAGKSSFLNHLTGRAVLPIGVVPLTAVITRLRYGPAERAEVRFLSGERKEVALDDIRLYVGEDQNPDNGKKVASVEVELPALKPLDPLQFVDTPGLGSAFSHNTEATRGWLPNVGAALAAISSDAPLSERDLKLLDELRLHTPEIVLLLTKADLLSESQRTEVLDFVQKQLRKHFHSGSAPASGAADDASIVGPNAGKQPNLNEFSGRSTWGEGASDGSRGGCNLEEFPAFFYSIRPEESALKAELEKRLLFPLVQNCAATASQIARHKLLALLAQTLNYLRIALAAATQAESSRQGLRDKLAAERRQFDLLRSELCVLSHEWSASALDRYLAQLHPTQRVLQEKITVELNEQFSRWHLRLPPMLNAWRSWLNEFLTRELSNISQREQTMFCEPLRKAEAHLTRTLCAFHDRLAEHVNSALGVTLTPREFTLEVREPTAPPVHVAYAFDAAFTTIGWLIPLTLFRKLIQRQLLRKARYEVEKNLSRLSADWHDRVARAIDELTGEAEKQALNELTALERTLAQTASNAPELRNAVEELEQFEKRLHSDGSSGANPAGIVPTTAAVTR